jgi:hypothetical protein
MSDIVWNNTFPESANRAWSHATPSQQSRAAAWFKLDVPNCDIIWLESSNVEEMAVQVELQNVADPISVLSLRPGHPSEDCLLTNRSFVSPSSPQNY